uniref:hypothetical protein n=1 Tax=Escherichia coli TaxID=562 RepID=UPI0033389792
MTKNTRFSPEVRQRAITRNGGKNSLNRLIRCVCGTKIGPDPRNFNQRVSLGRHDLLIRTFPKGVFGFGQRTLLFFFAGR